MCDFLQDSHKILILCGIENLLHPIQRSHYLQSKIKLFQPPCRFLVISSSISKSVRSSYIYRLTSHNINYFDKREEIFVSVLALLIKYCQYCSCNRKIKFPSVFQNFIALSPRRNFFDFRHFTDNKCLLLRERN